MGDVKDLILPDELNEAIDIAIAEVRDGYAQTYLRAIERAILEGPRWEVQVEKLLLLGVERLRRCKEIFKKYSKEWK